MYGCMSMYVCLHDCIYVCMYACMYVCKKYIYIYIHILFEKRIYYFHIKINFNILT